MDLFDIEEETNRNKELLNVSKVNRIKELEKLITKYQNSYYNGEAEIEDSEFDALWDELKSLDKENPVLLKIGSDSGNFEKANHVMPMGSQEKASSPEEFYKWVEKHLYDEYLVEYKLDGASLELQYKNGHLLRAVTRGNGTVGDVITNNALKMKNVYSELKDAEGKVFDFTGGIRGEVIMTHYIHQKFYSDKANCRNAANGLMKKKDGEGCENLCLITYDVWATEGEQPYLDEEDKLNWLKKFGFETSPLKICKTYDDVINYRNEVMETRKNLEYDIDGLVIKERAVNHEDALRNRPDRQIAFKFSLDEAVSILRNVEWNETGATYTPVAVFDPVELNGTTVKRASLVNTNLINSLKLKIGSHVVVVKRGEIIPKIINVVDSENTSECKEIEVPKICSVCNSVLIDEGTRLYCPNKNCSKKVLHQLKKWIQVCDLRDVGDTLITQLFNSNVVKSISDLYKLTVDVLTPFFLNEESISQEKKSLGAEKVYNSIQSRKNISLSKFIAGLDIEGIGETVMEKIEGAGYDSIEKLFSLTVEELSQIYGFAEIMAKTFVDGINENKDEIENLLKSYITIESKSKDGKLNGLSFCFTGELVSIKRAEAQNLVKQNGGTVKSSVVKGLSYLVTNDTSSGSSKNKKALELNIPVLTEKEFLDLLK